MTAQQGEEAAVPWASEQWRSRYADVFADEPTEDDADACLMHHFYAVGYEDALAQAQRSEAQVGALREALAEALAFGEFRGPRAILAAMQGRAALAGDTEEEK